MRLFERIAIWFEDRTMPDNLRIGSDGMDINPVTRLPTIAGAETPDVAGNPYGSTQPNDCQCEWQHYDRRDSGTHNHFQHNDSWLASSHGPCVAKHIPVADRLVARWEVSQLSIIPYGISLMAVLPMLIATIGIAKAIGTRPLVLGQGMVILWIVLLGTETGRILWTLKHRYASPRWLRAVHAVVGDDLAVHALAELMRQHRYEPDYVLVRSDMTIAIQQERSRRKEAALRAEGVRVMEKPEPALGSEPGDEDSRIGEDQRAWARQRRAAERLLVAAEPVTGSIYSGSH